MSERVHKIAIVALHPIQYQAALWRTMAQHPRFDLRVIYLDLVGIDGFDGRWVQLLADQPAAVGCTVAQ